MKWPWSKPSETEGAQARRDAEVSLTDARALWPEVNRVATSLRELRKRNHFAEQIELTFKGGR